ncbi:MAG: hypothetical protein IJS62_09310 [Bacteroidales bacterium]|nr:hypothetical protein [Bacteroidales bacterium]
MIKKPFYEQPDAVVRWFVAEKVITGSVTFDSSSAGNEDFSLEEGDDYWINF